MSENPLYPHWNPEPAATFFQEYEAAAACTDIKDSYESMGRTFRRFVHEYTAGADIHFSGTFAKTDHLLKAVDAPAYLRVAVQAARLRLRKRETTSLQELLRHRNRDIAAFLRFVAKVADVPLPEELAERFPLPKEGRGEVKPVADCLRVVVEHCGDDCFYATAPTADTVCVLFSPDVQNPSDTSRDYLRKMLRSGVQLNLVRPKRTGDGRLTAELIVYEPDYLVDVSAVANCCETYGYTPLASLIHRLAPRRETGSTLLGNLAGCLLDEEIRSGDQKADYTAVVKEFFRHHALPLLAVPLDSTFHQAGREQLDHIHEALHRELSRMVPGFDLGCAMVEPSFFSETLGLQGRMDFLQLDGRVVMEQKSGKCGFPQPFPDIPVAAEKHYVQILLYVTLLRHVYKDRPDTLKNLQAFLLYSRYRQSLLGVAYAPSLVFEAMKLRNRMVALEYHLAENGYEFLEHLTPDAFNERGVHGRLWTDYQVPDIEAVLLPLRRADAIERAYYYRFLTFLSREHLLSKIGHHGKEGSGFAHTWLASLNDKLAAGNIYDRLRLLSPDRETEGAVRFVRLAFSERPDNDMSNFRKGDIVILYPYEEGEEPDVRRTMVFRATIETLYEAEILLRLRADQADSRVFLAFSGKCWAIEHDFMESSYGALYRGVQAFLTAPVARKDLLLFRRPPRVDPMIVPLGQYGKFDILARRSLQAREIFLIVGPPGTGKTSYGLMTVLKEELLQPMASVLLMAYTNRAVDEICSKLEEDGLPYFRMGSASSCPDCFRARLFSERASQCPDLKTLRQEVEKCRIFVGTTTACNSSQSLFSVKHFSLAIVDEASQILEPYLLGPLCALCDEDAERPAIDRFVLIGDHKQLPAVVRQSPEESAVHHPLLKEIGLTDCRVSLFERFLNRYGTDSSVCYTLTAHGRMHPDIALFPNLEYYGGILHPVPLPHQEHTLVKVPEETDRLTRCMTARRVVFFDVPAEDSPLSREGVGHSGSPAFVPAEVSLSFTDASLSADSSVSEKVNVVEADLIAELVLRIYRLTGSSFSPRTTVGVIVPYRNQIATVRHALERKHFPYSADISIDTVERYQGSQRDYIIYGFTVSRPYQLDFLTDNTFYDHGTLIDRKLNVAMTRAREHLILVGNSTLLAQRENFRRLLAFLSAGGGNP